MAKRAELARRRRRMQAIAGSAVAVIAVVALAGFAATKLGDDDKKPTPAAQSTPTAAPTSSATSAPKPGECAYNAEAQGGSVPKKVKAPSVKNVVETGTVNVVLKTNQGQITLSLDRAKAPCTVNSFVSLAKQKYFDKTPCHRLTTAGIFVLQCGDPAGTGSGGPGYAFADEGLPAGQTNPVPYRAATVAMANAGPGTNGSQFFIVYKDTQFPPNYTIFGKVTKGLDLVQKIAKAGAVKAGAPAEDGAPTKPVTIESVQVSG